MEKREKRIKITENYPCSLYYCCIATLVWLTVCMCRHSAHLTLNSTSMNHIPVIIKSRAQIIKRESFILFIVVGAGNKKNKKENTTGVIHYITIVGIWNHIWKALSFILIAANLSFCASFSISFYFILFLYVFLFMQSSY